MSTQQDVEHLELSTDKPMTNDENDTNVDASEQRLEDEEEDAPLDLEESSLRSEQNPRNTVTTEEQEAERYTALINVTKKVQDQLPDLNELSVNNFEQVLGKFRDTFEEALDISEKHAQSYIAQAGVIEEALAALGEYNRKVLEQLSKITLDTVKNLDDPNFVTDEDRLKVSETLVERAKLLLETAEKQAEYSKHIGTVAKPLTSWRLDATKAVWEANNALKLAEIKCTELREKSQAPKAPIITVTPSKLLSEQSESVAPGGSLAPPTKTKKEPMIRLASNGPPLRASTKTPLSDSERLETSLESELNSDQQQAPVDPTTTPRQPIKFWPKHVYKDQDGEVICYIRAPSDCLLRKRHVTCVFSDVFAPWPPIPGHSEAIGRYVSIQPNPKYKSVILHNEPWIIGIPHNYCKVPSKEAVLYMIETGATGVPALEDESRKVKQTEIPCWRDLLTTDVVVEDTHYLEARLTRLTDVTFAPFARLRRDRQEIGRTGGQLMCMGDPRILLNVPPEAIRVTIPFALQMQHLDRVQLPTLIERNEMIMQEVVGSSPLVYLTCAKKILFKPISISLPVLDLVPPVTPPMVPAMMYYSNTDRHTENVQEDGSVSYASRGSPATRYDDFQKSLILPQLLAGKRTDVCELVLMQKLETLEDQWTIVQDAERINTDGEVVTFSLNKVGNCRLLALKIRKRVEEEILAQSAALLEKSVSQHMVYIALRQHQKQPEQLCLLLALKDPMELALQQLAEEGYWDGERPSGPVFLSENQHVTVEFRSNICMTRSGDMNSQDSTRAAKINFTSAVVNRHKFTVKVVDTSAQLGLDHYRGLVKLSCTRTVLLPATNEIRPNNQQSLVQRGSFGVFQKSRKQRFRTVNEQSHLASIVIKLPKQPVAPVQFTKRPSFHFEVKDAVTPKYLKELATKLQGDSWRRLGLALDMSKSRLQAISGKVTGNEEGPAHAMLLNWIKNLPLSASRFSILNRALQNIGRSDLATELCEFSGEYFDDDEEDST